MDYWPNIDAVTWFAIEVLPARTAVRPDVRFYIVGMNPAPAVPALARDPGVVVTGTVPDVRPYLQHAAAVVAPLRVARGMQNKVLEAMAMARPVVDLNGSEHGRQGAPGREFEVAESPEEFARKGAGCAQPGAGAGDGSAGAGAHYVSDYSWDRNLAQPSIGCWTDDAATDRSRAWSAESHAMHAEPRLHSLSHRPRACSAPGVAFGAIVAVHRSWCSPSSGPRRPR